MRGRTHWGAFRIGRDHETRKQKNSGNRKGQIPHRMMARTIKMMFAGLCANPDHEREIETTTWRAVTKRTSDTIESSKSRSTRRTLETKLAYGSSPVEFGGGLSLPGGIVIAIAPADSICGITRTQNEERTMRICEDYRIGGAACRVVTDDPGPLCVSPLTLESALRFSRTTQVKATSSSEQPSLWPAPYHQLIQT